MEKVNSYDYLGIIYEKVQKAGNVHVPTKCPFSNSSYWLAVVVSLYTRGEKICEEKYNENPLLLNPPLWFLGVGGNVKMTPGQF